jgi:hypothetical protein
MFCKENYKVIIMKFILHQNIVLNVPDQYFIRNEH